MALSDIERRVADLERRIQSQSVEIAQLRALEALRLDVKELQARYEAHEDYTRTVFGDIQEQFTMLTIRLDVMETNLTSRLDGVESRLDEQKGALMELVGLIRGLEVGQKQILNMLTGNPPRLDA